MSHLQHDAFPTLFATPPQDGRVRVYQATLLQDSPGPYSDSAAIYHVTPYRFVRPFPLTEPDAFWVPQRGHPSLQREVLLVAEQDIPTAPRRPRRLDDYGWEPTPAPPPLSYLSPSREVFFVGRWRSAGHALLSMYCAAPIPVLEMDGDFRALWPRCRYRENVLESIQSGTPEVIRVWERRWDPDTWLTEIAREFAEVPTLIPAMDDPPPRLLARSAPAPPPDTVPTTVTRSATAALVSRPSGTNSLALSVSRPSGTNSLALSSSRLDSTGRLPSFVLEALVRDAITRATTCPITMEPLTDPSQVTVTDCYHLFDATALASWQASGENKCPVCRETLRSM